MGELRSVVQSFSVEADQFFKSFRTLEYEWDKNPTALDKNRLKQVGFTLRQLGERYQALLSHPEEITDEGEKLLRNVEQSLKRADERLQSIVRSRAFGVPLQSYIPSSPAHGIRMMAEDLKNEVVHKGLSGERKEVLQELERLGKEVKVLEAELAKQYNRSDEHQIARAKIYLAETEEYLKG